MKRIRTYALLLLVGASAFSACKKNDQNTPDHTVNIFSIQDDKNMGEQMEQEIASNPTEYPLLDSAQYAAAYGYLYHIGNAILNSGKLNHKDDFNWRFNLIHDDSVLNAFATPGGKVYVYTGLIKYLESEDQLAGVMGHEIAHADRRHATDQLTKIYGVDVLLSVLLGDSSTLKGVTESLISLKYSRDDEAEADKYSVIYLYPTEYDARGAARFFEKLIANNQQGNTPEFLSDHPSPENRVENINNEWQTLGGKEGGTFPERYADFKASLP